MAPAGRRRWLIDVGHQGGAEVREPVGAGERKVALDAESFVVSIEAVHGDVLSLPGGLGGRARAAVGVELEEVAGGGVASRGHPLDDAKVGRASRLAEAKRGLRARNVGIEADDPHLLVLSGRPGRPVSLN